MIKLVERWIEGRKKIQISKNNQIRSCRKIKTRNLNSPKITFLSKPFSTWNLLTKNQQFSAALSIASKSSLANSCKLQQEKHKQRNKHVIILGKH